MPRTTHLLFVAATAMLAGCEQWKWPPYEATARDVFYEYRDQFIAIDIEMANDQLVYLSSSHIAGTERERAVRVQPKLNAEQRAKYRLIIGENTVFNFWRKDGVLSIRRYMPPVQGRVFTFWYVHATSPVDAPLCNADAKRLACGDCIVRLEEEWHMAWMWYPSDNAQYDDSCAYMLERESEDE